jgi:hypothetical protein
LSKGNDLFRWLRDFGPRFGWRQTGTLTKLQEAASAAEFWTPENRCNRSHRRRRARPIREQREAVMV